MSSVVAAADCEGHGSNISLGFRVRVRVRAGVSLGGSLRCWGRRIPVQWWRACGLKLEKRAVAHIQWHW